LDAPLRRFVGTQTGSAAVLLAAILAALALANIDPSGYGATWPTVLVIRSGTVGLVDSGRGWLTCARWVLALALGLRQGEALGLQWDDIDLQKGTIRVRRSRLRPRYTHGCGGTCGQAPGDCPRRVNTRPPVGPVRSKAGRCTIGLPPQIFALLRTHRAEQEVEQALSRQL
jgi:hypothetical protein